MATTHEDEGNTSAYTSNVAQTVDAASNFIRNNNPILVCFVICVVLFAGLFYYLVTNEQQRTKDIVDAIGRLDTDQRYEMQELKGQMVITNEHLSIIEKQTYDR